MGTRCVVALVLVGAMGCGEAGPAPTAASGAGVVSPENLRGRVDHLGLGNADADGGDDKGVESVPGSEPDRVPGQGEGPCGGLPEGLQVHDLEDAPDGGFLYTTGDAAPRILAICLDLTPEDRAALVASPREDVHARLTFVGLEWDVAVHLKGSENGSFQDLDGKPSFKVDVHEWDRDQRLFGVKRLTLNSMIQDPTMAAEHATWRLYEALGMPAPRHGYAQVWLDGELYGLYGIVETRDEQLMARLFDDGGDGTLYEGGYGADLYAGWEDNFILQEEAGDGLDAIRLAALTEALEAKDDRDLMGVLDEVFDRDALLTQWAVEIVTSNVDAYVTLANNYLLYRPAGSARWTMLPWGPDQSFTKDGDVEVGVYDAPYGRVAIDCRADAACSAALDEKIREVVAVWEEVDMPAFVASTTRGVEEACRADTRSRYGDWGCRDYQAEMRDWAAARPDIVRAELAAGPE